MKVNAENGDYLEIERSKSEPDAYDLVLLVRLRFRGFAAEIGTWVERAAWLGFTQDLVVLEARRQGEARLESISPGELSIVVRSLDRAGHMGVEGTIGVKAHDYAASLRLAVLVFDPSQLPALVNDARNIASDLC